MRRIYVIIFLTVLALFYLFYLIGTTKITVVFEELEPFNHNLPVYYKGFKLGHTTKVRPGPDFRTTHVDLRIVLKNLHLPANTSAILRRKDKHDYIELEYPDAPYIQKLKYGDSIQGHLGVNFENFLQNQAQSGGLDEIKDNVNKTVVSAGQTFEALTGMLYVLTDILNDVRPSIKKTVNNFEIASGNIADVSENLQKTVQKGYIDTTLDNFSKTSGNLVITTENFSGFSTSLNKQSSVLTNCLLKRLNLLVANINEIVIGVGNTLKKRFGGIRLFLGKSISN